VLSAVASSSQLIFLSGVVVMINKSCPWCGGVEPSRVTRVDRGCTEWQCSGCGGRWTVKDDHPGEAFAFFPSDIDAAFGDDNVKPIFEGA